MTAEVSPRASGTTPGVGDRIYLTPKADSLAVSAGGAAPVAWELYSVAYPTVGDSISLDESGFVVLAEEGSYAVQTFLTVDASAIDYAQMTYDDNNWGGTHHLELGLSGPPGGGLQRSCSGALTAWCSAGVNFATILSTAAAANLVQGDSWMHVVRIA